MSSYNMSQIVITSCQLHFLKQFWQVILSKFTDEETEAQKVQVLLCGI